MEVIPHSVQITFRPIHPTVQISHIPKMVLGQHSSTHSPVPLGFGVMSSRRECCMHAPHRCSSTPVQSAPWPAVCHTRMEQRRGGSRAEGRLQQLRCAVATALVCCNRKAPPR